MKLINKSITLAQLKKMSSRIFGDLVKAVIDIEKELIVIDAPMHADLEKYMLDTGSRQDDLWGINFYPEKQGEDFVEFDSMINIRPRLNNFSRGVNNKKMQQRIVNIVNKLVKK